MTKTYAGALVYFQNATHSVKICAGMPFAMKGKAILRVLHRV